MAGLRTEFVAMNIVDNLYPNDSFVNYAMDESRYANGALVARAQSGAEPVIIENRASLPALVKKREDTQAYYQLKEFSSDPDILTNADLKELNYNKKASLVMNHAKALSKRSAISMLYTWIASGGGFAQADTTLRTTGANTAAHVTGATLTRKALTEDDLQKARFTLDKQNIDSDGRVALLDANMQDQLWSDLKTKYDLAYANAVINGSIVALHGFKLLFRSELLSFDNAGTPLVKIPGATGAATDNGGVICWQSDMVAKAIGGLEVFYTAKSAEYYGAEIMSALLRSGGAKMRADAKGILAIVQTA